MLEPSYALEYDAGYGDSISNPINPLLPNRNYS